MNLVAMAVTSLKFYLTLETRSLSEGKKVHDRLKNNGAGMSFDRRALGSEMDFPVWRPNAECERFVAFVPFAAQRKIQWPYRAMTYLAIILIIAIGTAAARKQGKLQSRFWKVLNITSVLLGSSPAALPRTRTEKYVAAWFMFLAMTHSSSFYSDIIGFTFDADVVEYETFRDIEESNLMVYVYNNWSQIVFDHQTDPHAKKIQRKAIKESYKPDGCFRDTRAQGNAICIANENYDYEKTPLIRMAKPAFNCINWAYRMEAGSPYVEKLQAVSDRIFEAGITEVLKSYHEHRENLTYQNWNRKKDNETVEKYNRYAEDERRVKASFETNDFTRKIMTIVLATGYTVSMAVLICETGCAYLKYLEWRQAMYMRRMY